MARPATDDFLPLKPEIFQILLVLMEGELHGYGIVKAVERNTDGRLRLAPSLLYRRLRRLVDGGLAEAVPGDGRDPRRGRAYRLTDLGRAVTRAEARRLVELAEDERVRELAESPEVGR